MDGGVEREIFGRHTLVLKEEQWPQKHLFSSFLLAVNIKAAMKKKKKSKKYIKIEFYFRWTFKLGGICGECRENDLQLNCFHVYCAIDMNINQFYLKPFYELWIFRKAQV